MLEFLLPFVRHLNYYKERSDYLRYPIEMIIDKGGDFGYAELGIAERYSGEFSCIFWEKNGVEYYYTEYNGRHRKIRDYDHQWEHTARISLI